MSASNTGARQDLAGGVVRKVDRDQLGVGPQRARSRSRSRSQSPVGSSATPLTSQMLERQRFGGLVVRRDDDGVIVGAEQHLHRDIDRLPPRPAKHSSCSGADGVVGAGDLGAQRRRAEGFGVAEVQPVERARDPPALASASSSASDMFSPSDAVRWYLAANSHFEKYDLEREIPHRVARRRSDALPSADRECRRRAAAAPRAATN